MAAAVHFWVDSRGVQKRFLGRFATTDASLFRLVINVLRSQVFQPRFCAHADHWAATKGLWSTADWELWFRVDDCDTGLGQTWCRYLGGPWLSARADEAVDVLLDPLDVHGRRTVLEAIEIAYNRH